MEPAPTHAGKLVEASKRFARRLLTIGENRFELLVVEVQEERARLLHAILLALGVAAFGLLAGMALTASIVLWLWEYSPMAVLLTLTGLYAATRGLSLLATHPAPARLAESSRHARSTPKGSRMFGKRARMNPLELRKQLLIAESELHRAQLSHEWRAMAHRVRELLYRAKAIAAWAPSVALLMAGLAAFRRRKPAPAATQSSWFQRILDGARLASTIWFAFRARGHQEERQSPPVKPETCKVGGGLRPQHFGTIMLGLLLLVGCFTPARRLAGTPLFPPAGESNANGGAKRLDCGRGESPGNPVAEFMYFVALISPEPVSIVKSPGNTQRARMVSATRSFTARSFLVTCECEFVGEGNQRNLFDHTEKIRRHEQELKEGGTLDHQLGSINVEGAGSVSIEVAGTMTDRVPIVTEVRLRFNGRGQPSPVTIGLHDIRYCDGSFRLHNEKVARVNTLVFQRKSGPNKMGITVASVKRKDANNTLLQNLIGGLKGTAVNLFIQPITVERAGNEAMLNFGLALALEAPAFTFPRAKNLKAGGGPSHLFESRAMELKPGDTTMVSGSMHLVIAAPHFGSEPHHAGLAGAPLHPQSSRHFCFFDLLDLALGCAGCFVVGADPGLDQSHL